MASKSIRSNKSVKLTRNQSHKERDPQKLRYHSMCLLLLPMAAIYWWLFIELVDNDIIYIEFLSHPWQYNVSELVVNGVILLFSFYIYLRYVHRMLGEKESTDCTNFDLYAVLSLLWTLMLTMLSLLDHQYFYFACMLVRAAALIVPGYIHKEYIRYKVISPLADNHYMGDVDVYKIVLILFYAVHLWDNMIDIPFNEGDGSFRRTMYTLFHLEEESSEYDLPFIVAIVIGRPFLSMLLFHSLVLNITWAAKPNSYHDMDLFALSFRTNPGLNIKMAFLVITLFIVDLLCQHYLAYALILFWLYVLVSIVMAIYVIYNMCGCTKKKDQKKKKDPKHVDHLEFGESLFILIGSLIAFLLYASSKVEHGKVKTEYQATFIELIGWTVFFISQYVFIMYIEFNIDRIDHKRSHQFLVLSGAVSAVTIMYMFVFEYHHLLALLLEFKEFTIELKVAYSLFWCPIEYLVWSFVTTNHMLHHLSDHDGPHEAGHEAHSPTESKHSVHFLKMQKSNSMLFVQRESTLHLNAMVFAPLDKHDSDDSDGERKI